MGYYTKTIQANGCKNIPVPMNWHCGYKICQVIINGGAYELHYVSKSFARNGLVIMLDNGTATLIVNVLIDFELVVIKV